jgi:hypothetical protein
MSALCSDEQFIELFETVGPHEMARRLKMHIRSVYGRREHLEKKIGRQIIAASAHAARSTRQGIVHPGRIELRLRDGAVLIGSDSHYWPGIISTAHRAFVKFCKTLKPAIVIKNGDELDGATISRHPPINWEKRPSVQEELETTKDRLGEITVAAGKARRLWPLGNHDSRFETRLATVAPEYARVHGFHLKDHVADWEPCWSVWINDDVVIKHRFRGGIHATHNNTLWSGKTIVTGHLHSQKVTPITDYHGTRWGVDCGCIADIYGPQFEYMEDNARNWRSGFCVLTFKDGTLLQPELVRVVEEGIVDFRGQLIEVGQ